MSNLGNKIREIRLSKGLSQDTFAKDKLWKIYMNNEFNGSHNNGIKIGMKFSNWFFIYIKIY
mgnify:CR=1 FL=1